MNKAIHYLFAFIILVIGRTLFLIRFSITVPLVLPVALYAMFKDEKPAYKTRTL